METKTFTLQMQENAEYIFERYKGLIYKIARDILDDSLLAEDCLQEVVLKLALLPGKLNTDEYEYPDAFVAIVARNQALDMLKKQKRELPTEDVELQKLSNFATICKEDRYFVGIQNYLWDDLFVGWTCGMLISFDVCCGTDLWDCTMLKGNRF